MNTFPLNGTQEPNLHLMEKEEEDIRPGTTIERVFTIYVYNFPHILDHPPTFVYNFYVMNVTEFSGF